MNTVEHTRTAWRALEAWLARHAPETLRGLGAPADEAVIAAAERVMGVTLPEGYRAWLALHDGTREPAPLQRPLSSLDETVSTWRLFGTLLGTPDSGMNQPVRADEGVRAVWLHPGWIPIDSDGAGNHLCIDLAPMPGTPPGRIIQHWHDHDERRVVAPDFAALLEDTLSRLRAGTLVAVDDGDHFAGLMDVGSLTGSLASFRIRGEDEAIWRARARATVHAQPGSIGHELVRRLERHGLVTAKASRHETTLALIEVFRHTYASSEACAQAIHAALVRLHGDSNVRVTIEQIARAYEAAPFYEEVLGTPPAVRAKPRNVAARRESVATGDPLRDLYDGLREGRRPSLAWAFQYAPGGTLRAIWDDASEPTLLMDLGGTLVDRATLIAIACACIRARRTDDALRVEGIDLDALIGIERWATGDPTRAIPQPPAASRSMGRLERLLRAAESPSAIDAARFACHAMSELASGIDRSDTALCDLIRSRLPRPTLVALIEAFGAK